MSLPNLTTLLSRIGEVRDLGLLTPEIAHRLRVKNQAHENDRADRLSFVFDLPTLCEELEVGDRCPWWGGEALYNSHSSDPITGPALRGIGVPCIIEVELLIAVIDDRYSLARNFIDQYLRNRGIKTSNRVKFYGETFGPVASDSIVRIIRHGEPEFAAMTNSQEWRSDME